MGWNDDLGAMVFTTRVEHLLLGIAIDKVVLSRQASTEHEAAACDFFFLIGAYKRKFSTSILSSTAQRLTLFHPDTTALSIAFNQQNMKLPLRNRHGSGSKRRRRGAGGGSDDEESD